MPWLVCRSAYDRDDDGDDDLDLDGVLSKAELRRMLRNFHDKAKKHAPVDSTAYLAAQQNDFDIDRIWQACLCVCLAVS